MIELNEPMDKDKKVYLDVVEKQLNVTQNPIVSKVTKHSKPLREIKFRGKRLIDGTWIYGGFLKTQKINKYQVGGTSRYNTIIPETLGQYTGVHDKNGREIYEGDVVKLTRTNMYAPSASFNGKDLVSLHRVCWNDEKHCFYQEHFDIEKKRVTGAGILCFEDERAKENIIEVIGNIYDNPELLGGSDEDSDN